MSIDNLISIEFSDAELAEIDKQIAGIEAVIKNKVLQLTAEQSKLYGKLGNETENWAAMISADSKAEPKVVPDFVDTAEWAKDEKARLGLSPRATKLLSLAQQLTDTNRVIGYDIYQVCLSVYGNARFLASKNVPGIKALYEKWSVQFPGARKKAAKTNPATP